MLFYISETVAALAENGNGQVIDMLDNLYYSWSHGWCLVDGSRDSLNRLSSIDKKYRNFLNAKQSIRDIYKTIKFYIVLTHGTPIQNDNSPLSIERAKALIMDYATINDGRLFHINNLLCEHVEDAYIYKWGSGFLFDNSIRNIRLNITEQLGGGNCLKDSARNYHNLQKFTLCILDSDKHHPNDQIGQTAQDFLNEYTSLNSPFIWYYILEAHEVENLIPFNVLCQCNLLPKKFITNHTKENLSDSVTCMFFKYWDCKEGFKPSDLRLAYTQYSSYYPKIRDLLILYGVKQSKIDDELARQYNPNRNAALLNGYKGDILSKCSEYVENNSDNETLFNLDSYQEKDWNEISRYIWSIGCAAKPKRV